MLTYMSVLTASQALAHATEAKAAMQAVRDAEALAQKAQGELRAKELEGEQRTTELLSKVERLQGDAAISKTKLHDLSIQLEAEQVSFTRAHTMPGRIACA